MTGQTAHTDALAGLSGESDVSSLTPGGTPGVLDLVIQVATFRAISDSQDSVVQISAAGPVIENTRVVVHHQTGIDGDGNWLLVNSGDHFVIVVSWHIDSVVVEEIGGVDRPVAGALVAGIVWHTVSSDDTVFLGPHHSDSGVTTVAA